MIRGKLHNAVDPKVTNETSLINIRNSAKMQKEKAVGGLQLLSLKKRLMQSSYSRKGRVLRIKLHKSEALTLTIFLSHLARKYSSIFGKNGVQASMGN